MLGRSKGAHELHSAREPSPQKIVGDANLLPFFGFLFCFITKKIFHVH